MRLLWPLVGMLPIQALWDDVIESHVHVYVLHMSPDTSAEDEVN